MPDGEAHEDQDERARGRGRSVDPLELADRVGEPQMKIKTNVRAGVVDPWNGFDWGVTPV
jgi:hypothetical protein